jgi:hypothetical protein
VKGMRTWAFVVVAVGALASAVLTSAQSRSPQVPKSGSSLEVFRIFLNNGTVLNSHGQCATLPDELVCLVKLGGGDVAESHDVLTVPRVQVDEAKTTDYARALRTAAYGATRGDREYADLTADMARALGELESSTDRDRRLGIAQLARNRLATWSAEHYGFKAEETRQLVTLLDEVIAELRVAAGETKFSLDMVANLAPVPTTPLLPAPSVPQSLDAALAAAAVTPVAAERLAVLRSAQRVALATPGLDPTLKARVARTLQTEELIERQYRALMQDAIARADVAVSRGRASVLQRLIQEVAEADQKLGARRAREMAAFGRRLDIELRLAKEQQAAFARWEEIKDQLFAYELRLRPLFDDWVTQRVVLREVRSGVTARASALDAAARRFSAIDATLGRMRPLPEVREVHALLRSAVQMTRQGLVLGQRLSVASNPDIARNASSAISGGELLLSQARAQLVVALNPRKVR